MTAQLAGALAIFAAFLVLGAHAVVPFRLTGSQPHRATWARAVVPLLSTFAVLVLFRARLDPSPFVGAGLLPVGPSPVTTAALVGVGTLLLADLFGALFHTKLDPAGWRILGVVGALTLVAWSALEEAARIGSGPSVSLGSYLTGVACRTALGLAAGGLVFARSGTTPDRSNWPWAFLAVGGTAGLWLVTPPIVRQTLAAGGDPLTLAAGAILLAGSPFVPPRFRRLSAVLGVALLALFLARAGAASDQIGQAGRVAPPLP